MDPDLVAALVENPAAAFKQNPEVWSVEETRQYCARQRGLKATCICGAPRPVGSGGLREAFIFRPLLIFEAALLALPRCQLGIISFTASSLCCTAARLGHPEAMNAYADSISTGKWFGEKGKHNVFEDYHVWEPAHVLFKLRAADAGNPNALFDLARMFERGVLDPARCGYEPGIVLECYDGLQEVDPDVRNYVWPKPFVLVSSVRKLIRRYQQPGSNLLSRSSASQASLFLAHTKATWPRGRRDSLHLTSKHFTRRSVS